MLFRQLFDAETGSYTYLIGSSNSREAVIIDPVSTQLDQYLQLLKELDLTLAKAFDTHTHADHITALGALRDKTGCVTVMGEFTAAECVSQKVADNELIEVDDIVFQAIYTPGHTNESFSFVWKRPNQPDAVFTGDVLLYRGTGRTDFQAGDAHKSWQSITERLFALPDDTVVYAAHDYKGWTQSTIAEERQHNPRLAGKTEQQYVDIMNNLNLPNPKMMDTTVPANLSCGKL